MAIAEIKDWKELKGVSKPEFENILNSGRLDKFLNDQEFVNQAIKGSSFFEPEVTKVPEVAPVVAPPAANPTTPALSSPVKDGTPAPEKDSRKLWEKEGFANEDEFYESVKNLRSIVDDKQKLLDRYNAERGKEGRKLKELEEALKKEREERARLQTVATAVTVNSNDVPIAPTAPISIDGNYDTPEFKAKVEQYQKDTASFNEKMAKLIAETRQENQRLKGEVTEVRTKTSEMDTLQQESQAERQQRYVQDQWNVVMSEVSKLQDHDQDLKTSKSFEEINNFIRAHGYEEASKIYPRRDIDNFDRICDVIKTYRPVDDKGNVDFTSEPRYKNMKVAYHDMLETKGELDKFLFKIKTQGAREGREQVVKAIQDQGNHAKTLPIGAAQNEIVNEITNSDIDDQLKEYSKPEYDTRIKSDVELQRKVYTLMKQKAEKDPVWQSMIPTAWIAKFEKK